MLIPGSGDFLIIIRFSMRHPIIRMTVGGTRHLLNCVQAAPEHTINVKRDRPDGYEFINGDF